tara:strand:- start:28772 stop:30070 length:1299 start_codon:yes stop_codon:yes gene_type:complete
MNLVPVAVASAILSLAPSAFAQEYGSTPLLEAKTDAASPTTYGEAPVKPEAQTGLSITGSFFTRYELREGYDDIGRNNPRFRESDFVFYRARLGLTTTPIDIGKGKKVILMLEPQASGFWADSANTLTDGALNLHQATMRISGDSYWIDTGRFEMAYGDHLVIGNVDWHQSGRSFDGIRSRITLSGEKGWVDVFATQVLEDPLDVKPFASGDAYFSGVYAGLGQMLGEDIALDAYLLNHVRPRTSEDTELGLQFTLGSRYKGNAGPADVRAEAGVQVGTGALEQLAFQGEAEVGTKLGKTRVAAVGWYASGDDPTTAKNEGWDELYPTAHKFMGLADIAGGRSNIMGGIARVRHALGDLGLGADGHVFLQPEPGANTDAFTGVELDAWALQNLGKGLGLRGGYSIFAPNEGGSFGTSDLAHYVEVQLAFALK